MPPQRLVHVAAAKQRGTDMGHLRNASCEMCAGTALPTRSVSGLRRHGRFSSATCPCAPAYLRTMLLYVVWSGCRPWSGPMPSYSRLAVSWKLQRGRGRQGHAAGHDQHAQQQIAAAQRSGGTLLRQARVQPRQTGLKRWDPGAQQGAHPSSTRELRTALNTTSSGVYGRSRSPRGWKCCRGRRIGG